MSLLRFLGIELPPLKGHASDYIVAHGFFEDAMGCVAHAAMKQLEAVDCRAQGSQQGCCRSEQWAQGNPPHRLAWLVDTFNDVSVWMAQRCAPCTEVYLIALCQQVRDSHDQHNRSRETPQSSQPR
jgi:hypothetical protein